ncbi:MAG: hypothetical protein HUK06_00405 [Bacteroidaceae bacterium]|mgnify:CR=1 FL=1|nr:hypothetical protein [Bacteroidaceae bacterium]
MKTNEDFRVRKDYVSPTVCVMDIKVECAMLGLSGNPTDQGVDIDEHDYQEEDNYGFDED